MKLKKIYCFMLVIILVINAPIIAYADSTPGTVSVSGGTIGSGGVEGNSGVLKGTALTILMATLASIGIQVKQSVDDYEHGNSALNFVEDKFNEWEQRSENGWAAYQALNDSKIGQNGEIYVNENATNYIQQFVNWLKANNEIQSSENTELIEYGNQCIRASVSTVLFNPQQNNITYHTADGEPMNMICIYLNGQYYAGSWRTSNYAIVENTGNVFNSGQYFDNLWAMYFWARSTPYSGLEPIQGYGDNINQAWNFAINAIHEALDINIGQTGFYGDSADIPTLIDESGNGKILTVQPGLIPQVQDGYTGSNNASINVQDYLKGLSDLYGQKAIPGEITDVPDITLPAEDAITGTKEDVAVIDRDIVLDPDITVPADEDAITWPEVPDIAVPVADPSVPCDPDTSIPAMSFDLTQYFPFCLPFDIYHILLKLNADPVTPEVTIDWGDILGTFGIDYVMNLDLHDYDNIAELLRNMETAAFVVGLAVVTRQMFLRG